MEQPLIRMQRIRGAICKTNEEFSMFTSNLVGALFSVIDDETAERAITIAIDHFLQGVQDA